MKATFRTVLSVVLSYLMVISILPLSVLSTSAADNNLQGEGTQESPYRIYSAEDFAYAMTTYGTNENVWLSLENDIDISGLYQLIADFKAHLNGNYHSIISMTGIANNSTGVITSLCYYNNGSAAYTTYNGAYGGLVGRNQGIISNTIVSVEITEGWCYYLWS